MKLIIYGPGCKNCVRLTENIEQAIKELQIEIELEKITDLSEIISAGVMRTPGLAIDNKIIAEGEVLKVEEIKELLVTKKEV